MTAQIKLLQTENAALHAEIADLHAQLEAVGAGGVEALISNAERKSAATLEPFGYFKAEPFGWTDCAESDEGAIALYEAPQPQQIAEPAGMEPVAELSVTGHSFETKLSLLPAHHDLPYDATYKLYTAAQVQAMLAAAPRPSPAAVERKQGDKHAD